MTPEGRPSMADLLNKGRPMLMETPLVGEWYWGIVCPVCERHCPMYRDVTQGTAETTVLSTEPRLGRIDGQCPHCKTSFDVPAERFHHFQIPETFYD